MGRGGLGAVVARPGAVRAAGAGGIGRVGAGCASAPPPCEPKSQSEAAATIQAERFMTSPTRTRNSEGSRRGGFPAGSRRVWRTAIPIQ
jgi:hypothetical protein